MANNQYVNKVSYVENGTPRVLIDISNDTVTPSALAQGYTAHDASGAPITGTATGGAMVIRDEADSHGGTIRHITAGSVVQGTLEVTANGTYDVAAYADVDVDVAAEDSTFVVTMSWNDQTNMWEPDCTYSEVQAAHNAGKHIDVTMGLDMAENEAEADGYWLDETSTLQIFVGYHDDSYLPKTSFYELGASGYTVWGENSVRLQAKAVTPSESQQVVQPDMMYSGLSDVTVGAISSTYVGSGITRHSPSDITVSGDTVTVPDGYYAVQMSKSVAPGTAGTPTATKGSVSNHAISVTPSVTNATGYITGGTKTGTAVSVSASELVSGTLSITENGTTDVTNYASVNVNVSGGGGGGGGSSMSDPIRFFDYDGTLVASYSAVPSSLPSVPTHDKLTNGTWNYTLAQVATQFNAMGTCDVGANYDTVSGATEIDIVLQEGRLHPYLSLAIDGTVTIDWGDNSTNTATGTSLTTRLSTIHHEYTAAGSYTIKITKTSGAGYSLYCSSVYTLLNKNGSTGAVNRVYSNFVQAVRVGEDCVISGYAFHFCNSLKSVSIPSSVTSIGGYAFNYCYTLESVSIPSGVTSIGANAFQGCFSLKSVSIPSSVTSIVSYMFYNCYTLESVSIPSGVTSIGTYAFSHCEALASISIPSGVTSIDTYAFNYCYTLESVSIPSSVTSIGTYAFNFCNSLKSVSIPSSVTSIVSYMFNNCTALASISIPSGVTSIGTQAFGNCPSLASISIPSGVTSIGANAFTNAYGVAEYHLEPTTPPTLANTNAFTKIESDCVIYVPAESLTAYQEAENWSTYASRMVGE